MVRIAANKASKLQVRAQLWRIAMQAVGMIGVDEVLQLVMQLEEDLAQGAEIARVGDSPVVPGAAKSL